MDEMTATLAVIPARWSSSRFPGKVLAPLAGRPVILHVLDRVSRARQVDACLVATDDERIAEVVRDSGHEAVMTRPDHPSGSDRIAEAITGRPAPIILNVQGDEPLVDPAALDQLVLALKESDAMAATLAVAGSGDIEDRNVVKVVCDAAGYALYFSRAPIPASHPGRDGDSAWLRHVGVYAWRRPAFEDFVARAVSRLEQHEGLEQLRFLEHGGRMHVEIATSVAPGVDTPEDLARCEALLARSGRQV